MQSHRYRPPRLAAQNASGPTHAKDAEPEPPWLTPCPKPFCEAPVWFRPVAAGGLQATGNGPGDLRAAAKGQRNRGRAACAPPSGPGSRSTGQRAGQTQRLDITLRKSPGAVRGRQIQGTPRGLPGVGIKFRRAAYARASGGTAYPLRSSPGTRPHSVKRPEAARGHPGSLRLRVSAMCRESRRGAAGKPGGGRYVRLPSPFRGVTIKDEFRLGASPGTTPSQGAGHHALNSPDLPEAMPEGSPRRSISAHWDWVPCPYAVGHRPRDVPADARGPRRGRNPYADTTEAEPLG